MQTKHYLSDFYNQSLALLTDLYQLTMAYAYWKAGLDRKEAVFHLFFRRNPFNGGFAIAAGLESVVDFVQNFHFSESDLAYLRSLRTPNKAPLFEEPFFDYLKNLHFTCDLDAIPEGTAVFPHEPLLRVQGPIIQCQLLESPLLNLINFPTLIATKAARVCLAAKEDPVFEFGVRRAQGIDGSLTASRSAFIGGCEGTSNVLAGKLFDIPVRGTHAHAWIMAFDDEREAFQTYTSVLPQNCIFLVDTYNTLEGVKRAMQVGKWMQERGQKMFGIRLDSGDLAYLSIRSREMLDAAGFRDAKIVASNELDEVLISDLKRQGAKIDIWGVGTHLVTGGSQHALDGIYKLSAVRDPGKAWKYKLKLSDQMTKVSNPGMQQVRRCVSDHMYNMDMLYDIQIGVPDECILVNPLDPSQERRLKKGKEQQDLLVPLFRKGTLVYKLPKLLDIQTHTKRELAALPNGIKRFINPHIYPVGMEKTLYLLKLDLMKQIRSEASE
jgi:nicotinate phosphoribosyltransferase